ncbi:MAG: 50S ribosomal protein L13 [Armatimonadota bacterium]|nr:MAG: 50S ribosomal protein L13 [Armatimonadota bacterium]
MRTKTYSPRKQDVERKWLVVDAAGTPVGRVAAEVAALLRGKHKPIYAPHVDTGDHVVVINADKLVATANKATNKMVYHHSGYPGGLKAHRYGDLLAEKPQEVLRRAVRGMLPHNRLGRAMLRKLKIYRGPDHPHQAQRPQPHVTQRGRRAAAAAPPQPAGAETGENNG